MTASATFGSTLNRMCRDCGKQPAVPRRTYCVECLRRMFTCPDCGNGKWQRAARCMNCSRPLLPGRRKASEHDPTR